MALGDVEAILIRRISPLLQPMIELAVYAATTMYFVEHPTWAGAEVARPDDARAATGD